MRNVKTLIVALVAVFAFSAIAASAASAKKPEWTGTSNPFVSKSGVARLAIPAIPATVICESSTDSGTVVPPKGGEVTVLFKNCYLGVYTNPCGNQTEAQSKEIKTEPLTLTLGYINKSTTPPEVGVALAPKSGAYLAQFECDVAGEPYLIRVTGSVIGNITPVNTMTTTYGLAFTQSGGVQVPTEFKETGAEEDVLTSEVSINGGAYNKYKATEELVMPDEVTLTSAAEIIA